MITSITSNSFHDAFRDAGRRDQFSYQGLNALYNYLTELEDSCDMKIELDVIALYCEYSEDDLDDTLKEYGLDTRQELENNTTVIDVTGTTSVIIQNY